MILVGRCLWAELICQVFLQLINMRNVAEYAVSLIGTRSFQIYYGDQDFIDSEIKPERTSLGSCYPNPFSSQLNIPFTLAGSSKSDYKVVLVAYDISGHRIDQVVNGEFAGGFHQVSWQIPGELHPGLYYIQLTVTAKEFEEKFYQKVILR